MIKYTKNCLTSKIFTFLQNVTWSVNYERGWNGEFKGHLFYSCSKINSWVVAIGYLRLKKVKGLNHKTNENGQILLTEVKKVKA